MWELKGNEKNQEQLDAYKRLLILDPKIPINSLTLSSIIWRMVFKQEHTYYKYETQQTHQCSGSRLRSVEDIYSVAKNYVKDITRKDVEEAIEKLMRANLITQSFCRTVNRRVHTPQRLTVTLTEVKNALNETKFLKKRRLKS